jgi:O-succinylbenzoic acid--CoA ligase
VDLLRPSADAATTVAALRGWLEADRPAPLLIETSGSSGLPKRVVLSRAAVIASARATERRLGGPGPWALALPSAYVAGVQVVVRSLLAGHQPVLDGWGGARFTSLVPTQLHRMLASPDDTAALAAMDAVLLGGGSIDPDLRRRAEDAGVRVVATYGSSETAGGCVYDGVPLDGVAVAVGAEGRIRIAGPVLFDGYDGDPALTAASLVDGWFLTSDVGRLDEDGRLQVLGRLDDVVVSGGVKVPLPAVAARLREHPDVAAAEVLGVEDPEWGQRVVAFVVVISTSSIQRSTSSTSGEGARPQLRDWVAERHPRSWAPRDVVVVDALPLLANGKVDRAALREMA